MYAPTQLSTFLSVSLVLVGATGTHAQDQQRSRIQQVLETPCSVVFEDTHLKDITDFMTTHYEINIVVDNRVVAPRPGEVRTAVDRGDYATKGMIHYVNLKNVTLGEALEAILEPLGLTYAVESSFVWISNTQHIRHETFEDMETRVFELPGRTLPDKNSHFQDGAVAEIDLMSILRRVTPMILEPQTGELLSYMRLNLETNQLVVHNTPTNLNRLETLLELLLEHPATN